MANPISTIPIHIHDLTNGGIALWTIMANHGLSSSYGYGFFVSRDEVDAQIEKLLANDKGEITEIRATGMAVSDDPVEAAALIEQVKSIWQGTVLRPSDP